ncbi:hypothetical protein CHS0354_013146 [Potamilus streckersoni]|uniref:Cytosine-specific methyltransferase n=1 Tax=Potamilus streckersoni TaxID=2493646 RepID=A0AAE0S6H7_9BIVA|nr:hypothetical protein CHS0354_013146 [Potamilus streckersoni]
MPDAAGWLLVLKLPALKTIGYEKDADCCLSYQYNLDAACFRTLLNKTSSFESGDVVIGGPPCQPFSVGGYQKGEKDNRDGFPVFIKAVKDIKPKVWLFENVRGLLYKNKLYLQNIIDQLAALGYKIELKLINTSHYKVPQNRERLIVVGHQSRFFLPETQKNKITAYEALGKYYDYAPDNGKYLTASMDKYVKKYETASKCITPRDLHKDMPARTVTCRNIAGATGDMLRLKLPDGRRRRLLVQEAARLQSFPDWFKFQGTELTGVGHIDIADGDTVSPSNLNRQILFDTDALGKSKAVKAAERLAKLNPHITLGIMETHAAPEMLDTVLPDYKMVMDCTDTLTAKLMINRACLKHSIPLCHAGVLGFECRVMTVLPGRSPCVQCLYTDINTDNDTKNGISSEALPTCTEAGILGSVAGFAGTLMATEAVKYITESGDLLVGRVFTADLLHHRYMTIAVEPLPGCICRHVKT